MHPDGVLPPCGFLECDAVYCGRLVRSLRRIFVPSYQTTRCDISKDLNFYSQNRENFKFRLLPYLQKPTDKFLQILTAF
jgi:hypothetical protein